MNGRSELLQGLAKGYWIRLERVNGKKMERNKGGRVSYCLQCRLCTCGFEKAGEVKWVEVNGAFDFKGLPEPYMNFLDYFLLCILLVPRMTRIGNGSIRNSSNHQKQSQVCRLCSFKKVSGLLLGSTNSKSTSPIVVPRSILDGFHSVKDIAAFISLSSVHGQEWYTPLVRQQDTRLQTRALSSGFTCIQMAQEGDAFLTSSLTDLKRPSDVRMLLNAIPAVSDGVVYTSGY